MLFSEILAFCTQFFRQLLNSMLLLFVLKLKLTMSPFERTINITYYIVSTKESGRESDSVMCVQKMKGVGEKTV